LGKKPIKISNYKIQMSNEVQNPNTKKYDLEERTAIFGEDVIRFAKTLPSNQVNKSFFPLSFPISPLSFPRRRESLEEPQTRFPPPRE
jgi:hypothetical protein